MESVFHSPGMRQHVLTLNLAQVSRADTHIYTAFMFALHTSPHTSPQTLSYSWRQTFCVESSFYSEHAKYCIAHKISQGVYMLECDCVGS